MYMLINDFSGFIGCLYQWKVDNYKLVAQLPDGDTLECEFDNIDAAKLKIQELNCRAVKQPISLKSFTFQDLFSD